MSKKILLAVTLAIALVGLRGGPVDASTTVDPGCGTNVTGTVKLTHDLGPCLGNGLSIFGNKTKIDLGGFTLSGSGTGFGIAAGSFNKARIKNGKITGFATGILLQASNKTHVDEVDVSDNGQGLTSTDGDKVHLQHVIANRSTNGDGIYVTGDKLVIAGSTANANHGDGFDLIDAAGEVTLNDNQAVGNYGWGFNGQDDPDVKGSGNTGDANRDGNCSPLRICVDEGALPDDDDNDGSNYFYDCDDHNEEVHPGATEIYNGIDDDCDGSTDEGTTAQPLLISEVAPLGTEFIEIRNTNLVQQDLDQVYLADNADYWGIGCSLGAPVVGDFRVHFPTGATIPANGRVVVATGNAIDFNTAYGKDPDYAITASASMVPLMIGEASSPALTNAGEPVVLFKWTGGDLVADEDYVFYGTVNVTNPAVNKSGKSCPPSNYNNDAATLTPIAAPSTGFSVQRTDSTEGLEIKAGGNGINGHDETTENVASTFSNTDAPTPGT